MGSKVNANPTKEFFISMLTRDIDIRAAILELIDNSIDGAKRMRPKGDYSGLYIRLSYNKDEFRIVDNCGGISIQIATEYAFRFGRSSSRKQEHIPGQSFTGIFGIGMKRSLFRLGEKFDIKSSTDADHFRLLVDVKEWIKDDGYDWSFQLSEEGKKEDYPNEEIGTNILVTNLHDGISKQFELSSFSNSLIEYIERFRTLAVENGLEISINGMPITFSTEKILKTDKIIPYSKSETIGSVTIKVIAGIAPKGFPKNAGWYVYCNGRLVVFADQTSLTVWGEDGVRNYHPSLAFFRGFVFFESQELGELPWNTTKTNVDSSSKYYIYAKTMMREATIQVLNKSQPIIDGDIPEEVEKAIFTSNSFALSTTNIASITQNQSDFSLEFSGIKVIEPMTSISFKKPSKLVEIMKKSMHVSTNKEVGIRAFDYYFKRECDDDE